MTSEEFLVLKTLMQQNQRHLEQNQRHLQRITRHIERDRWYVAFGSDVAANLLTNGLVWLVRRISGRISIPFKLP